MAEVSGGHSEEHAGPHPRRLSVHPWRLVPPLLVLLTVAAIWLTRSEQLLTNHWAYPAMITIAGLIALYMVVGARPRLIRHPLPYPES